MTDLARRHLKVGGGRTSPATWEHLIELLDSGISLKKIIRRPDMPSKKTVKEKRRRDPAYDARVSAALERAKQARDGRRNNTTPEAFQRVIRLLAEGYSLDEIGRREDAPSRRTIYDKRKRDPAYKARVEAAMVRGLSKRQDLANLKVSPVREHVLTNTLEAIAAGVPLDALGHARMFGTIGEQSLLHEAKINSAFAERLEAALGRPVLCGRAPRWGATAWSEALNLVRTGQPVTKLGQNGTVSYYAIWRRSRLDPAFAGQYQAARRAATRSRGDRRLNAKEIYGAVTRAVPAGLPPFIRDDVIGEMVAEVLEGLLHLGDVAAAAREYVSDYYRQAGPRSAVSMDAPWSLLEGRTGHDLVAW